MTDMAMAAQSGQVEDDVRADGHGSVTNASSNSLADGGPTTGRSQELLTDFCINIL